MRMLLTTVVVSSLMRVAGAYCSDDLTWSFATPRGSITCANYSASADPRYRRSCFQDHHEDPNMYFDVSTAVYHNTHGLDTCSRCCATCHDECCSRSVCPRGVPVVAAPAGGMRSLQSEGGGAEIVAANSAAAGVVVFHECSNRLRYDCATGEYVLIRPLPNATEYNTLSAVLRMRSEVVMDDFDFDARLALRHAVSLQWGVPQYLVSIHDIVPGVRSVDVLVHVGPGNRSGCTIINCEDVLRPDVPQALREERLFTSFAGARLLQEPVCQLCPGEQLLSFSSAGTVDDPFSCPKECAEGFFRFQGFDGVMCQEHARPQCLAGQYLLAGTPTTDAQCVQCSACEGKRFVAACSATSDTVCENCPAPAARQYWQGADCTPACEEGYVWNTLQLECEFCAKTKCDAGWRAPERRDNCSHCVPCSTLPAHAHWSTQDDRFDCMWLCDENYELDEGGNLTCVAQVVAPEPSLTVAEAVCDAGHMPVNLSCVPCFTAQSMGLVAQKDLPLPADENKKWQWLYACKWQCLHSSGYWELRSLNDGYWECTNGHTQTVMLRGVDSSWINLIESGPQQARRSQKAEERKGVATVLLVLVAVPVLLCVLGVAWKLLGLLCAPTSAVSTDEQQPLLQA